jgi:F0F1-type ATP synthase epsilon subunit
MKKYIVSKHDNFSIKEIEVAKDNGNFVTLQNGSYEMKNDKSHIIVDSIENAKEIKNKIIDNRIKEISIRIFDLQSQIALKKKELDLLNELKNKVE